MDHDSLLWSCEALLYFWMRQRQVWKASLVLSVEKIPWSYHITMILLITVRVRIVEANKYLCNSCDKHLIGFLQGLGFFINNLMNPPFDSAFNY